MRSQIRDLRAYAGLGLDESRVGDVDLGSLVDRIIAEIKPSVREYRAEISRGQLPVVRADETEIAAVLQNLMDNAVKFRGSEPLKIHVAADDAAGDWVISVRDNGIGIEAEYFDRIFDMFQRLHPRSDYSGTGTGLAICKKIIERRGGRIWVESAAGRGATFFFTIPK